MTLDWLFHLCLIYLAWAFCQGRRCTVPNCWQQCNTASAWQVSCCFTDLEQAGTHLRVSLGTRGLQRALSEKAAKGRVLLGLHTCCLGRGFWGGTFEDRWGAQSHFPFGQAQNPFCPVEIMLWVNNPKCCTQVPYTAVWLHKHWWKMLDQYNVKKLNNTAQVAGNPWQ